MEKNSRLTQAGPAVILHYSRSDPLAGGWSDGSHYEELKNILLLRHAKSDWEAGYDTDHNRPLAQRGRSAARLVGRFLASSGPLPELVLTSSAVRARKTAELAKESGRWTSSVIASDHLYQADPDAVLQLIRQQDDAIKTLMLVGHNPTWEILAQLLIGGGALRFPTGALARIKSPRQAWVETEFGCGTLSWLMTPKLLTRLIRT